MIKLWQGDCLELMKQIPNGSVDMILCDLPYGTTQNRWDICLPLPELWEQYKRVIKSNGAICLFAQTPFDKVLGASNLKMLRYEWIWQKNMGTGFLNANKMPLKAHENILVFYSKLPTYNPQKSGGGKPYTQKQNAKKPSFNYGKHTTWTTINNGERYPLDVLKFGFERGSHPTQKPVPLCEYLIKTYTNEGETVLDNCMGSGTTGVACVNTNRSFIGIELDENYFEIAKQRIGERNAQISMEF